MSVFTDVVLNSATGQPTSGSGHICTRSMAKVAAVRFSLNPSHSPSAGEGETGAVVSHSGSPQPPIGVVVCRSDTAGSDRVLACTSSLGSSVAGIRRHRHVAVAKITSPGFFS